MLYILFLIAEANSEWVEIAQYNHRRNPVNRVINHEFTTEAYKLYKNHTLTEPEWHKGNVNKVPHAGNVRRVPSATVKAPSSHATRPDDQDLYEYSSIYPNYPKQDYSTNNPLKSTPKGYRNEGNSHIKNVNNKKVSKNRNEAFKIDNEEYVKNDQTTERYTNMKRNKWIHVSTKATATNSEYASDNSYYQHRPYKSQTNSNVETLHQNEIKPNVVNPATKISNNIPVNFENSDTIKRKNQSSDDKPERYDAGTIKKKQSEINPDINNIKSIDVNPDSRPNDGDIHLDTLLRDLTKNLKKTEPATVNKFEGDATNEGYLNDDNLSLPPMINYLNVTKVNELDGLWKFIKVITDTISRNTKRSVNSKIKYLKELRNNILYAIEDRIDAAWPDDDADNSDHSRSRRSAEARGHLEFPSSEGALMSISFLTFAVFLIKLVLQVIHTYKNKTMMVTPAVMASVGRAAAALRSKT